MLIVASLTFVFLANRDIKRIYGGLTKVVDASVFKGHEGPFVINNVNVLSADGTHFIPKQTVTIENGLIAQIANHPRHSEKTYTIDGQGQYLIPGLTDAHVHLFKSPNDLLLYVANGVTQIRELIGEEDHLQWREEINHGRLGPDMFIASPRIGSFETLEGWFMEWSQGFLNIPNAQSADKAVRELHQTGYDAVKIYSQINKETYYAVVKTAKSLGMKVVGHVPWSVEMSDIYPNQDSVAHLEELMNAINREFGGFKSTTAEEFLTFVEKRSDEIAKTLQQNNMAVTTTLWLVESFVRQKFALDEVLKEVELDYENPGISEWTPRVPQGGLGWLPEVNRYQLSDDLTEDRKAGIKKYWYTYAQACQIVLRSLMDNQVMIMTGTDANLPPTVPGFSLHDEFISLKKVGMSATQILRSSTILPALWLDNNAGVIAPGKKANLVLLDKNPLIDISHTKSIDSVIINGRLLDRPLLDEMLAAVKQANDESRTQDISVHAHTH